MSTEQLPVSAQVIASIGDARVAGTYSNHPIAEADIGILLHVIAERDSAISQWSRMYASLISVVANTQEALGFDEDESATANGSAEIVAEIEDLKQSAADNAKCNVEAIGVIKSLRQQLAERDATIKLYQDAELVAIAPTVEICQLREQLAAVTAERDAIKRSREQEADYAETCWSNMQLREQLAASIASELRAQSALDERERIIEGLRRELRESAHVLEALNWVLWNGIIMSIHHIDGKPVPRLVDSGDYDSAEPPEHLLNILNGAIEK